MVEIISKSDSPRREDAAAKHFLRENAATINKIVHQLSGGRLAATPGPEASRLAVPGKRMPAAPVRSGEPKPYTKVSLNGRVIAVDFNSGRQLYHLGEIRGQGTRRRFVLATEANRFFAPLAPDLAAKLVDLDSLPTPDDAAQEDLVAQIDTRLGF